MHAVAIYLCRSGRAQAIKALFDKAFDGGAGDLSVEGAIGSEAMLNSGQAMMQSAVKA